MKKLANIVYGILAERKTRVVLRSFLRELEF